MTTRKNIITLAGGGSTLAPNIVRGGKAIDLGNNFYYIKGRKHKNGGVDVGENAKTGLEVEGEEVMQVKPNEVRVFSSVPFLRGVSPAELVMNGNNPDAVFNAQERFKDINKINDDGTKYKYNSKNKAKLGIVKSNNNITIDGGQLPEIKVTANKPNYSGLLYNIRKRAYNNISPYDTYNIKEAFTNFKNNNRLDRFYKEEKGNPVEAVYAIYLGIPNKDLPYNKWDYIEEAEYLPTKGKTYNKVVKLKDKNYFLNNDNVINALTKEKWVNREDGGTDKYLIIDTTPKSEVADFGPGWHDGTISVGNDDKGTYVSYYDEYNLNPIKGTQKDTDLLKVLPDFIKNKYENTEDVFNILGTTPVSVYDRRYVTNEEIENLIKSRLKKYGVENDYIIQWSNKNNTNNKKQYGGNMIASINGNVKNGLIHTEMKCGGRRKAVYGSYNMRGIERANYIASQNKKIQDTIEFDINNLEKNLTDKEKENIVKDIISRERKYAKGNVEIVSPEFDALMIGRTIASGAIKETAKGVKNLIKTNKTNKKTSDIDIDLGDVVDKNVDKYVTKRIPKRRARKYNIKEKSTKTIEMPDITINQGNSGLFYGKKINNPNLKFTRRTMDAKTSRELDKIYNKVIGNNPPRSGFEFKYQPTEIPYSPSTNDIGRIYDAAAEWNKYFGKRLYKDYVTKYGKKGVDKALKKEGISIYKYGGRKKADWGISYFAPSLFGPKYDKVINLNSDGTRSERSLLYADATNPNRSFTDILLNGELDNYSGMGNFSNRRIEGYRNITPSIETSAVTPVATKATTPTVSTTSATPAVSKTSSVSSPVKELIDAGDYTPDYSNDKLEAIKYDAPKNQLISKLENDLFKPIQSSDTKDKWLNDDNLDKINLYTNIGASAADFITSTILNSQLPTYSLPTMTAPSLSALPEIKLADIKEIEAPKTVAAAKLKTRYNANPQLSKIEDETRRTIDDIDRNTADSRVALARKQRARIASQEAKNQVYGQKENIETDLINKDKLNAQAVAQSNATAYNNYLAAKAQQAMGKAQLQMMVDKANIGNKLAVDQFNANAKLTADQFNTNNKIKEILGNNAIETTKLNNYAQGVSNLLGNIGGSIDTFTRNSMSRKRDAEALRALRARYKDVPDEILNYIIKG